MKEFSEELFNDIRKEIEFIWKCHDVHDLEGKMRLYAPVSLDNWKSHEAGFEVWFGREKSELDNAIKKLNIFYQEGREPNTPFFLDPIVCKQDETGKIMPVGSGVTWCTILCKEGDIVQSKELKRVKDLGVFMSPIAFKEKEKSGYKILAFLKDPLKISEKSMSQDGSLIAGTQAIADLFGLHSESTYFNNYMLSGVKYNSHEGQYQHEDFSSLFAHLEDPITELEHIKEKAVFIEYVMDAATCWNAYDRVQYIYDRYGVDVAGLKSNLQKKKESDAELAKIEKELTLIWQANSKLGLEGEMRLFTPPDQNAWRSKDPGTEVWFSKDDMQPAVSAMQYHYNSGMFPNSPLLLDPVIYQKDSDDVHIPQGSAVVWTTSFSTGLEVYNPEAEKRIKLLGLLTGDFIRAGDNVSGVKALGFLNKPQLFSDEFKQEYKNKYGAMIIAKKEHQRQLDTGLIEAAARDWVESMPTADGTDKISVDGCKDLFDITNVNGAGFEEYYLLTGIEYLCTNGAFASDSFSIPELDDEAGRDELIKKHTVSIDRIKGAVKCWNAYDRIHLLWDKFGIEESKLEKNLKFYNLCGRDLALLGMVASANDDSEVEKFEFLVSGWVAKNGVTLLCASGGTGKSTLAHKLALSIATDWKEGEEIPKWLGSDIERAECTGMVVYFSGDDSAAVVAARAKMLDPEDRASRLLLKCGADFDKSADGEQLNILDFFANLEKLPEIALIIIDPAKKYLTGDENESEVVAEFFEACDRFAVKKSCSIVVLHSLAKDSHPKVIRDMAEMLRGSEEFMDRPRIIIGEILEDTHIIAGLAKNALPPGLGLVDGERIFVRDPEKLSLVWLAGEEGVRHTTVSSQDLKKIKEESDNSDDDR